MSRSTVTAALFTGVTAAAVGLSALLLSATGPQAAPAAAATAPAPAYSVPALAEELAPGADLTVAQADALTLAADRVCEGLTAEVPVMVLADTLVTQQGLSDEEARDFVHAAAAGHCARPDGQPAAVSPSVAPRPAAPVSAPAPEPAEAPAPAPVAPEVPVPAAPVPGGVDCGGQYAPPNAWCSAPDVPEEDVQHQLPEETLGRVIG